MDAILSQAKEKGLFVVNSEDSNESQLLIEFNSVTEQADRLCEVVDPEDKPFDSKYKARDLLDEFLKKLEANQAIATLEKKEEFLIFLRKYIASIQTRIGGISFDCEEPHNAQTELEAACKYYFPEIIGYIEGIVGDRDELLTSPNSHVDPAKEAETVVPPDLPLLRRENLFDGMKCLNLLGILWAGRGHPLKSLYYLLAANSCYQQNQSEVSTSPEKEELENLFTHNLFYLAQAYGNLKSMKKSSTYCHQTLQRQLRFGLVDLKSALDWVKNCCGIADFYLAVRHFHACSYALLSAEKVLKEKVIQTLYVEMEKEMLESSEKEGDQSKPTKAHQRPNFVMGNLNAAEIEADLHRRFAVLDGQVLRLASERWQQRETAVALALGETDLALIDEEYLQREDEDLRSRLAEAALANNHDSEVAFFDGLWISELPHLSIPSISSFETARSVFLRAAARIELAKKYYVLDGYVTDHVILLQEHSKLFHSLNRFETDFKRKIAMESRRIEILGPILKSLNIISFEVLHKQVSYELGEAALGLLDLKLDKVKSREEGNSHLDEKSLKKSEVMKCNDYAKQALVFFAHFTFLYAQSKDRKAENTLSHFESLPLYEMVERYCSEPDESLISEEEVRPFLNANFLSCRVLSKVIVHPSSLPSTIGANPRQKAIFLIASLHRYQWLTQFIPKICQKRGLDISAIFGEEYQICQDMVKLLPSKIDRMCYLGESAVAVAVVSSDSSTIVFSTESSSFSTCDLFVTSLSVPPRDLCLETWILRVSLMSFLALFAAIPQKPKWNQQKVQSIKTEFFTRPNVRAFLKHLTFLLNNNTIPDESDPYVRELHEAGVKIGLRLQHQDAFSHVDNIDTDDDLSVNSLSDRTTGGMSISSCVSTAAINSELKKVPYWNDPLTIDDPQLKLIMHEIALKSSVSTNIFLVEQKRDRLIHAYITLCSRVKRLILQHKLCDPETSDAAKYSDLKGLFEINYFHTSSFEDIVVPHRKKIMQEAAKTPSPSRRHRSYPSPSLSRHSSSESLPSPMKRQRHVLRNSASLYFQHSL